MARKAGFTPMARTGSPILAGRTRSVASRPRTGGEPMADIDDAVRPDVAPSGPGCADCVSGAGAGWWFHLRRCAACGHVGCCDSSPSQHARAHAAEAGHRVIQSFEPGEDWFYDF